MDISLYHELEKKNDSANIRACCIVFHGLTGTPDEMLPTAKALFAQGFDVFVPSLSGHEQSIEVLRHTRATAWLADVTRAYETILNRQRTQLFAIGLSFGGLLALSLAVQRNIQLAGLALLSTPFALRSTIKEYALRALSFFPDVILDTLGVVAKARRSPNIFQEERKGYPSHSIGALARAKYIQRSIQGKLAQIQCPTLIIQDPNDHLVGPKSAEKLRKFLPHADVHWVTGGEHELPIGPHGSEVNSLIADYFAQIVARKGS